jgi:hypothetical protein
MAMPFSRLLDTSIVQIPRLKHRVTVCDRHVCVEESSSGTDSSLRTSDFSTFHIFLMLICGSVRQTCLVIQNHPHVSHLDMLEHCIRLDEQCGKFLHYQYDIFWDVTLHSLVNRYQQSAETCYFFLQGNGSSRCLYYVGPFSRTT